MTGLKSNPGGYIPPAQVIGRDQLCEQCWRVLERRSIRLTAERRIGKTTVIHKLRDTAPSGVRTRFRDVGGLSTVTEFVEFVIEDLEALLADKKAFSIGVRNFLKSLAGFEFGGVVRIPELAAKQWKVILQNCFDELNLAHDGLIVLFWDEVPWMLQKIKKREGEFAVIDLLDTLRGIRQTHKNVRMAYTGSIGLHHVISVMEEDGALSAPFNDTTLVNVPPLLREDGIHLSRLLLQGDGIRSDDLEMTAQALHDSTGGVPFYIHQVVSKLGPSGTATPAAVDDIVAAALADPDDPWEMRHFDVRLKPYYGDRRETARTVLDALVAGPLTVDALHAFVKTVGIDIGQADLASLLRKMQQDHYLAYDQKAREYSFQFLILKRWWRGYREL